MHILRFIVDPAAERRHPAAGTRRPFSRSSANVRTLRPSSLFWRDGQRASPASPDRL